MSFEGRVLGKVRNVGRDKYIYFEEIIGKKLQPGSHELSLQPLDLMDVPKGKHALVVVTVSSDSDQGGGGGLTSVRQQERNSTEESRGGGGSSEVVADAGSGGDAVCVEENSSLCPMSCSGHGYCSEGGRLDAAWHDWCLGSRV